jgi:hypothetical protein
LTKQEIARLAEKYDRAIIAYYKAKDRLERSRAEYNSAYFADLAERTGR